MSEYRATEAKRNCRWCAHCIQEDEGWFYCCRFKVMMPRAKVIAHRNCLEYIASWCPADTMEEVSTKHAHERELALYERRMRGDWT